MIYVWYVANNMTVSTNLVKNIDDREDTDYVEVKQYLYCAFKLHLMGLKHKA